MAYRRIYGSGSSGKGPPKGWYAVKATHRDSGKSVAGVTLRLERDRLNADYDGHLPLDEVADVELSLQNGKAPVKTAGKIVERHPIGSTGRYAMTVEFAELADEDARRIETAVESRITDLTRFFREFPLFEEFTEEDARLLSELTSSHFLRRKEVFFRGGAHGDELDGLFIVRRGLIQIYKKVSKLREEKIAVASSGEIFGELSLVLTQPHTASIRAVNDSELIEITRVSYDRLRATNINVAVKLMEVMLKVLAKRLGRTTKLLFSPTRI